MEKLIKLFDVKIESWGSTIRIRAYDALDAVEVTRILFNIPSHIKITVIEEVVANGHGEG